MNAPGFDCALCVCVHLCFHPTAQLIVFLSVISWIPAAFVFDALDQDQMRGGMQRLFGSAAVWVRVADCCVRVRACAWVWPWCPQARRVTTSTMFCTKPPPPHPPMVLAFPAVPVFDPAYDWDRVRARRGPNSLPSHVQARLQGRCKGVSLVSQSVSSCLVSAAVTLPASSPSLRLTCCRVIAAGI
jgi:hypothetical protein